MRPTAPEEREDIRSGQLHRTDIVVEKPDKISSVSVCCHHGSHSPGRPFGASLTEAKASR